MRNLGIIALLILLFTGGLMTGLMYEPRAMEEHSYGLKEDTIENAVEEFYPDEELLFTEEATRLDEEPHVVSKIALGFEKLTKIFFESVLHLFYVLTNLLFSLAL